MNYLSPQPDRPTLQGRGTSNSSTQSHQTGTIKEHWNDLPESFTPTASRSVSRTGTPLSRDGSGALATMDGDQRKTDFNSLLSVLLNSPSSLSQQDTKLLATKIQRSVPSITPEQKSSLGYIIQAVAIDKSESPAWGRQQVVDFMMREKGVSSWAIAVRKLVENVV